MLKTIKKVLKFLETVLQILVRLPVPFSLSLMVLLSLIPYALGRLDGFWPALQPFFKSVIIFLAIMLAYNLAVLVNLIWFKWFPPMRWLEKEIQKFSALKKQADEERRSLPKGPGTSVGDEHKIGIILAGGGAKGAYQAGALKAIYEYLEAARRLPDVSMVAGTSIGAWNALFWLADLVRPLEGPDKVSFHQYWWEHLHIPSMAMPTFYFPFLRNSLASTEPWKKQFEKIFRAPADNRHALVNTKQRFYFTKANVVSGNLDFTTNNPGEENGIPDRRINALLPGESTDEELFVPSFIPRERYTACDPEDPDRYLEHLRNGVFASMTFPPVVPQHKEGNGVYEDGGAIDNLPIYFGSAIEDCDFLFILPLNADFAVESKDLNRGSLVARLTRVLGVRQGALEQHALKRIRLYNELASARAQAWELDERLRNPNMTDWNPSQEYYRNYGNLLPINVFAICPDHLVVNTLEFWKDHQVKSAFEIMYQATKKTLRETDPLASGVGSGRNRLYGRIMLYKVNDPEDITPMSLEDTPI